MINDEFCAGSTAAQLAEALDNAPIAVFVSDIDSRRLLYANSLAKKLFCQSGGGKEKYCYQAAGSDEPCEFCHAGKMSREDLMVREFCHPVNGRIYRLSGKLIDWNGKPAHVEYIQDVTKQKREEEKASAFRKELTEANEKMQDIINAIPGGVAIYRVSDIFETVYFSDGVPELSGYTVEEYRELARQDAAEMIYFEDAEFVVKKVMTAIQNHTTADFEFRKQHRDGHVVWVHVQAKQIGEQDGCPLIHCVFHNISALKEAQRELDHLVKFIPGGIASYYIENGKCILTYYSDGVPGLSGHTREEFEEMIREDAFRIVYEADRERVLQATGNALDGNHVLDVSFRMCHKDGTLIWIHLNGRRMDPGTEPARFYAVFTGMSAESRLYQSIANESADGIYVIGKENYDLLYVNEEKQLFARGKHCLGEKCYKALQGRDEPCEFCTLKAPGLDEIEHEMEIDERGRCYATRFRETDWNGVPAYIKYVRDVTDEMKVRQEKERLERYFQTVVENLPGGVAVIRCKPDGSLSPEFISEGLAAIMHMSLEDTEKLYKDDIFAGVHPDDVQRLQKKLQEFIATGEGHCELNGRMKRGKGSYVWVKGSFSMLHTTDGIRRLYVVYTDISSAVEEEEQMRKQYNELLLKHYRIVGPDTLFAGHCDVTSNKILELMDYTGLGCLKGLSLVREEFFSGIAELIVDPDEKQRFLDTYLNEPLLAAFKKKEMEHVMDSFIRLPQEECGRYVQFRVNLVEAPDSGDVTGILTVLDITDRVIAERILHQLSVSNYDFVVDIDLRKNSYNVLSRGENTRPAPPQKGCHSEWMAQMVEKVVPRDRERYWNGLEPSAMVRQLEKVSSYTFAFSVADSNGDIRTKNMTVAAVDLRIGRVCLSRSDITDSVREQQGLLNMMAYTFELAGFLNIGTGCFTMYDRKTVLENLSPMVIDNYDSSMDQLVEVYGLAQEKEEVKKQFRVGTILHRLDEKPMGYDFVVAYRVDGSLQYKQFNVLWGDENHRTVCIVQADVTDMLTAERQVKRRLENALALAEEASRAKSDFLSAMSHDIRTPMNAIAGMTALASAHLDDRNRVEDCLKKISLSSRHLLSLVNDILDMSKIERSKITLNRMTLSIYDLIEQLSSMMTPQAKAAGLHLEIGTEGICQEYFCGDGLRINQILINLLSNAIKFTPEGGRVNFITSEIPPVRKGNRVRYRFVVRDTGIGMTEEFMAHVFEPFTRSSGTARVEGTGLGLSITKGLVELMGGTIVLESRLGEGSVFTVELEWEAAAEESCAQESRGKSGEIDKSLLAGRRFLVAEDNPINAEILCGILDLYGAEAVVRSDGVQAVRAFREMPPGTFDAVLMDIQMPEMNGYEATRAIRIMKEEGRPDAADIPIVAMTANAFAEDVQASRDAGMTAHVAKPLDLNVLKDTFCRILDLHPQGTL